VNMKKRIIGAFLALSLLLTLLPVSVSAAPTKRVDGVDYTRIKAAKGYDVKLTLGELEFWGDLSRGTPLSEAEQDKIIREVMTTWPRDDYRLPQSGDQKGYLTSGVLSNLDLIATGQKISENLTREMISTLVGGIVDAASNYMPETGAGPLGDLAVAAGKNYMITLLDMLVTGKMPAQSGSGLTGSLTLIKDILAQSAKDIARESSYDMLDSAALEPGAKFVLKKLGKSTGWLKHAFAVKDLLMTGIDAKMKYDQMLELIEAGLQRAWLLNDFYAKCNERIAAAGGDDGEWRISFHKAPTTYNFNFWGVGGLMSEWELNGELVRQVTGAGDNYGGTYEGLLMLEIGGIDMKNSFDAKFKDSEVFFNGGRGFVEGEKVLWNNQRITDIKDDFQTTILKRTVSGEFTVYILDSVSGEFTPTVLGSLTSAGDKTEFSFDHNINGTGVFSAGGASIDMIASIQYTSNDIKSYTYTHKTTANGYDVTDDWSTGTVQAEIGTMWKPLDSEPKLTLYLK